MLDASWLPDVRRELYSDERKCLNHIKNNTFEETPFRDYFIHWDQYIEILTYYSNEKDIYDAKALPKIAEYYNEHTNSNTRYDLRTGKKTIMEPTYSSSSDSLNDEGKDSLKKLALGGGAVILAALLIRSCSHAEQIDEDRIFIDSNNKRIEYQDEENNSYEYEEVITSSKYPVKIKKLR